jgi:hypothetical protein
VIRFPDCFISNATRPLVASSVIRGYTPRLIKRAGTSRINMIPIR